MIMKLLNTAEIAKLLRVSESWIEKQRLKNSGPPFVRIGGKAIRYVESDVIDWLCSNDNG